MANLPEINEANFDAEVLQSDLPVLIDFTAAWCGPCKQLAPVVEKLAEDMSGRLKVVKCDIDQARDLAARYQIFSIPTLLLLVNGEVKEQILGAASRQAIEGKIGPHLG